MSRTPSFPVTVIVPVYKGAAFLAETLRCIVSQTLQPARVLVLEDGCPHRSADAALPFSPAVELHRKPNTGVSDTRNQGLAMAKTEWVCFMDQDDLWEPDHLARQAATLAEHPGADACYSGRRHLEEQTDGSFFLSAPIPVPPPHRLPHVLMDRAPFTPSAVLLRRSCVAAVNGFRSQFNGVEDWDLWIRLQHAGARFIHSAAPTLHYRIHKAANTNNPLPNLARNLEVVRTNILPNTPVHRRPIVNARLTSRFEAEAAILLRENGMQGARQLMLRSLVRHPLHSLRRHRIFLHMLLRGYKHSA